MPNEENIVLFHKKRVGELSDLLVDYPEDTQAAFDLMFLALVIAETRGVEPQSVYEVLPQQYKLVQQFLGLEIET